MNEHLIILLHIVHDNAPCIKSSVTTKPDLSIVFHHLKAATKKLGRNVAVPDVATGKKEITEFLEAIKKWDRNPISTASSLQGETVEAV